MLFEAFEALQPRQTQVQRVDHEDVEVRDDPADRREQHFQEQRLSGLGRPQPTRERDRQ